MQAPIALVTLVDLERQWFKSCFGLDQTETATDISFCAHAIAAGDDPMVVTDATTDPRFKTNPLVTGKHHVRFYAGAPMVVAGARIGTLCVLDRKPHAYPSGAKLDQLKTLASLAASLFTLKDATRSGAIAEAALAREEKRRAIALDAASLASWAWDIRTDMIECDVRLSELFNLPRSTRLRARDILTAIDPRDVYQTETRFRDALSGSDDYFGEYRVKGFHPPRWVATRGRVIERDGDGKPTLIFGVNYDISERKLGDERQRLCCASSTTASRTRWRPSRRWRRRPCAMPASRANSSKLSAPVFRRWASPTISCPTASGAASASASSSRSRSGPLTQPTSRASPSPAPTSCCRPIRPSASDSSCTNWPATRCNMDRCRLHRARSISTGRHKAGRAAVGWC